QQQYPSRSIWRCGPCESCSSFHNPSSSEPPLEFCLCHPAMHVVVTFVAAVKPQHTQIPKVTALLTPSLTVVIMHVAARVDAPDALHAFGGAHNAIPMVVAHNTRVVFLREVEREMGSCSTTI